jgi:hypothetical protein
MPDERSRLPESSGGSHSALFWVVILVLILLVDGSPAVATHGATSMRIIVWEYIPQSCTVPTSVASCDIFKLVFDKTITDIGLVCEIQARLDDASRPLVNPGGGMTAPDYVYEFRFATLGVTTQVYHGSEDEGWWDATTLGIPSPFPIDAENVTLLDGENLMDALHNLTGMPEGAPPTG